MLKLLKHKTGENVRENADEKLEMKQEVSTLLQNLLG